MKKLLLILLIVLITLFSFSASAQTYELNTSNRIPTIVVPFLEESLISSFSFKFGTTNVPMTNTTEDNITYEFTAGEVLAEGLYILTINPTDTLGNPASQPVIIDLNIEPVKIWIIEPPLEVSPTEVFDVIMGTSEAADCRYSKIFPPASYDDADEANSIEKLDDKTHRITGFTAPDYPRYQELWVICKDRFGYDTHVKEFDLSVDTTPPVITEAKAEPELVSEYDASKNKTTKLKVTTDDPTVCKYSLITSYYKRMNIDRIDDLIDGFFYQNDELLKTGYKQQNEKNLTKMGGEELENNRQYLYYVSCKNLAQSLTEESREIIFTVNLSAEFAIMSTYPTNGGYLGSKSYILNVSTNKDATCYYNRTATATDKSTKMTAKGKSGDFYLFSSAQLTGVEGQNNISIYCKPAGTGETKDIKFTIDTTVPLGIKVNVTSSVWMTDFLAAEFFFEDNESGIAHYNYTVKDSKQNIIIDNTLTEESEVTIETDKDGKKLNLTDKETYMFYVTATNKAGKTSQQKTGSVRIDVSAKPKDTFPPVVVITTKLTSKGTNITFTCTDPVQPSSRCNASRQFYGMSDTKSCSSSNKYNKSFLITKAQYICYKFYDNAGNPAENTTFVNVSKTIDTDGDGVVDGFDECLGTPIGQTVDDKGCSCSQLDDDNDRVNNCNDKCNNTPASEQALSNGCSSSQIDTDKDGMPDDWEDANGLDKYDPTDAKKDNDKDGLTNLEEYKMGTDPNNHDTDGDGFWDGGERTSGTDPNDPNSKPVDKDGDFIDDNWETEHGLNPNDPNDAYQDPDGDGLNNFMEYNYNTNPKNPDSDGDHILDGGEVTSGTDPNDPNDKPPDVDKDGMDDNWEKRYTCMDAAINDAQENKDNDTLTNLKEYLWGTNPCEGDTDGDGMPDDWEIRYGLNPNKNDADEDPDKDKFTNLEEYKSNTNPRDKNDWPRTLDTDGDGIPDWWEKENGLNPKDPTDADQDPDGDGLTSIEEYSMNECLDPLNEDTDGDGFDDGKEIASGTDPCDPSDMPKSYWWILILIIILIALGAGGYFGYKYLYPMIEKKFGRPTLRKWPPFEKVVGAPRVRARAQPKAGAKKPEVELKEKPKPKTAAEKLTALATAPFDRLAELTKPKEKTAAGKAEEEKTEKEMKEAGKETEGKFAEEKEAKEKTTTQKLEEIGRTSIDKLTSISETKSKAAEKSGRTAEGKKSASFDMLEKIGKAGTREEIFNALPSKKEDIFAELRKATKYTGPHLENIERITKEKDIEELVKTFEKLKSERGAKASVDVFKTLLGHLMKAKKININDVEEVLLKLKDEGVFSDRQISDVLFSLKE